MRNLLRTTMNWFGASADAAVATDAVSAVETLEPVESTPVEAVPAETAAVEVASISKATSIVEDAPVVVAELEAIPIAASEIEASPEPSSAAAPAPASRARGPELKLMIRGSRHYAICPGCEATWSLRDRLFDPRTGRPADIEALVCPMCLAPVSLPEGTDLRSVR